MRWTEKDMCLLIKLSQEMMFKDIAKKMRRTVASVSSKAHSIGLKSNSRFRRKYRVNDDFFTNRNSLECCYWAGFVAADGCVGSPKKNCLRIKIQDIDLDHLKIFKNLIEYNGKFHISHKNKNRYVCINIHSEKIINDLAWFKIIKRKSLNLEPPPLDGKQALAFLIGYIDGDGCISIENIKKRSPRLRLHIVGTYKLLFWIKEIFDKLVPFSTNANPRKMGKTFQYSIASKKALYVLLKLQKIKVKKLDRKWNKINQYKEFKNEI